MERLTDELQQHSGQSSANLELSEEKRRSKETALNDMRDKLTAAKNKIEQLEEEAVKQTNKASREINRLKLDLENARAERDTAAKEKRELEERLETTSNKLQTQLTVEENKALELQKVFFAAQDIKEDHVAFV